MLSHYGSEIRELTRPVLYCFLTWCQGINELDSRERRGKGYNTGSCSSRGGWREGSYQHPGLGWQDSRNQSKIPRMRWLKDVKEQGERKTKGDCTILSLNYGEKNVNISSSNAFIQNCATCFLNVNVNNSTTAHLQNTHCVPAPGEVLCGRYLIEFSGLPVRHKELLECSSS